MRLESNSLEENRARCENVANTFFVGKSNVGNYVEKYEHTRIETRHTRSTRDSLFESIYNSIILTSTR